MTKIKSKTSGRVFNVESKLYGTSNLFYYISLGGILLCKCNGVNCELRTIEAGIEYADTRADELGIIEY